MTIQRPLLSATLLALSLTIALPLPVLAALPAAVDGQPLPTLAPMLEQATPGSRQYRHGKSRGAAP